MYYNGIVSLKSAVNYARERRSQYKKDIQKIKWFDSLPITEKQDLFYKLKGRKMSLAQFLKDHHKIEIYNMQKAFLEYLGK